MEQISEHAKWQLFPLPLPLPELAEFGSRSEICSIFQHLHRNLQELNRVLPSRGAN